MKNNRVFVTGMGCVSSLGNSVNELWDSVLSKRIGIRKPINKPIPDKCRTNFLSEVTDVDYTGILNAKEISRFDDFSKYALKAASEAVNQSGLSVSEVNDSNKVGVIIGTSSVGCRKYEDAMMDFGSGGARKVNPFVIPMLTASFPASLVSMKLGIEGLSFGVASACASGGHAISQACDMIKNGKLDVCVCGGTDAPLTEIGICGFDNMRVLSTSEEISSACTPFDLNRKGFILGEGCGIVVLESEVSVKRRNAEIISEIAGFGQSSDAYHLTAPSPDAKGAVSSMSLALNDAEINPDQVDYICAHGTGTKLNDYTESLAIKKVFNNHTNELLINSLKSYSGHLLGATSAIEIITTSLVMSAGLVFPTLGLVNPDPDCDLNYCPNDFVEGKKIQYALSNSFGFGGHNVSIVIKSKGE